MILMIFVSIGVFGQLPYTWTTGVDPGWISSNPTVRTLSFQSGCYNVVSTSDCTGSGSWSSYINNQITTYTSPNYSFVCGSNINVSINLSLILEDRYDWLYFQYSTNGGASWINPVSQHSSTNGSFVNLGAYPPLTNYSNNASNRNGWTNNMGTFNVTYNIPASTQSKFRFIFATDVSVNTYNSNSNIYFADILGFSVSCPSNLPIELIYFNGEKQSCSKNILSWATATETNNDHFEIERSLDAINFKVIQKIPGTINSMTKTKYVYLDSNPEAGINYYRLKQVDLNGEFKYANIIDVDNSCMDTLKIVRITNLLGQEVTEEYGGTKFIYYSDGSIVKKLQ